MSTKLKIKKNERYIIAVLLTLVFVPLIVFSGRIDNNYLAKVIPNGEGFASMLAPLFSLIGSILVYIAFKAQIKANKLTQKQFKHSQLIGLVEGLNNRIISFSIDVDGKSYSGYSIFQKILIDLNLEQNRLANRWAIAILTSIPEKIIEHDYEEFLKAYSDELMSKSELEIKAKELKATLIAQEFKPTWLYNNFDINREYDTEQHFDFIRRKKFLESLAKHYFQEMDGNYKTNIYELSLRPVTEKYEIFLDSFLNSVFAILDLVYKSKNDVKENKRYIENVFTNQEKILLYHKLMSGTTTRQFGIYLVELGIFNMNLNKKYFLPNMSVEQYHKDIAFIKPLIYAKD